MWQINTMQTIHKHPKALCKGWDALVRALVRALLSIPSGALISKHTRNGLGTQRESTIITAIPRYHQISQLSHRPFARFRRRQFIICSRLTEIPVSAFHKDRKGFCETSLLPGIEMATCSVGKETLYRLAAKENVSKLKHNGPKTQRSLSFGTC